MSNYIDYQTSQELNEYGKWTEEIASYMSYPFYKSCLVLVTEDSFSLIIEGESIKGIIWLSEDDLNNPQKVASYLENFIDNEIRNKREAEEYDALCWTVDNNR